MATPNTNTALAPFEPTDIVQAIKLAETLARSGLVPVALRGKPDDVLVVLMKGRELGMPPMASLANVHVIDGKAGLSADALVGLVLRSGKAEYFTLVESTDNIATYKTKRVGSPHEVVLSYRSHDAERAGLLGKDNWKKYKPDMLCARCSARLSREVYPDVMAGLYEIDELDDIRATSMRHAEVVDDGRPKRPSTVDSLKAELKERLAPGVLDLKKAEVVATTVSDGANSPPLATTAASAPATATTQDDEQPFDDDPAAPKQEEPKKPEPLTTDPAQPAQFEHRLRFKERMMVPWAEWKDDQPWRGQLLAGVSCEQAIQGSRGGRRNAGLLAVVDWAMKRNYPAGSVPTPALKADWCLAVLEEKWQV